MSAELRRLVEAPGPPIKAEQPTAIPADETQPIDRTPALKLIERDLGEANKAAYRASLDTRRSAEGQIGGARQTSELALSVGVVAANVARDAQDMVSALAALRQSSETISAHAAKVNVMTASATERTAQAEQAVNELAQVAHEIAGVIDVITLIARQTTMLAHNANIQAARAGEAGAGFAVIAHEVRKLSADTSGATEKIRQQINALQNATRSCKTSVAAASAEINTAADMCTSIDNAAHSQLAAIAQLSTNAAERAADANALSGQSQTLGGIASASLASAERIAAQSSTTEAALGKLHDNLFVLLTQTRTHEADDIEVRQPILLRCSLDIDKQSFTGETIEFGLDGALLRMPSIDERLEGKNGACRIDAIGTLPAEVLRVDRLGVHLQFSRHTADIAKAMRNVVEAAHQENAPLVARAVAGAAAISQAMQDAVAHRQLSLDQLFDRRYQPIPGSDPVQYTNAALSTLERILTPIQEDILASDKRMAFCASVDLEGYLPVHNRVFSQPQRSGDSVWNAANCRNKRIFNDRAGLAAARNTQPHLVQFYARDMGGGRFVMMKEIDAPIVVDGRHWGGFRTSYKI